MVCYLSVGIWSILYGISFMIIPGKLGTNYYMCTGEDPRSDYYTTKKYPINAMLPLISLLIYIGGAIKIGLHRRKIAPQLASPSISNVESSVKSGSENKSHNQGAENKNTHKMKKKTSIPIAAILVRNSRIFFKVSFLNFYFKQLLALTLILESLLWSFVVNRMTPEKIMNDTLGTFMVYWHNNLGPMLFVWSFLALTYIKNPALVQSKYLPIFLFIHF